MHIIPSALTSFVGDILRTLGLHFKSTLSVNLILVEENSLPHVMIFMQVGAKEGVDDVLA